jgi:hypothetical protein
VTVGYRRPDGSIAGAQARVLDFDDPENNDWLAMNQFTVVENRHNRRPDVVLFVNGLPLAAIELKNPADEQDTIRSAYRQLQTYKQGIPSLFTYNEALVISDGLEARIGTLTADWDRFMPWRTIDGETVAPPETPELEVLMKGVFEKRRFLQLVRDFIVFEDEGGGKLAKKMAGYHQFHAVNVAVKETLKAAGLRATAIAEEMGRYEAGRKPGGAPGDRRIGVVWHTQGSGKSLKMVFYAGRIIRHPQMQNPTIVVLTDRNDLDGQLFGVFSRCRDLLGQDPVQAESRAELRELLQNRQAGGVIFTTIQKFLPDVGAGIMPAQNRATTKVTPTLSDRRNIVVIADEAHRSQYDFIDGFARHMRDALPNACFIGFTGTPLELEDRNTRSVFGDYISIYDIQWAVEDKATVPIYYESRLAKLNLPEELKPRIDEEFEKVTEDEEVERKEKLKTKWAQLEAVVGAEERLRLVAQDIVGHFEERLRALDGKAMVVCMSRRICVELYNEIVSLRPDWHHDDDKGEIKVVMTGSASDPVEWQPHIRNKARREFLANRFRNPKDPFKIVIVRDMWLTGFDCPSLHTMYLDKPMRAHGLMQAIARVNRVFRDKPGGLVMDYLGLAHELKQALATYTESGGTGRTAIDQAEAVAVMKEKYEICCDLFHGFDLSRWKKGGAAHPGPGERKRQALEGRLRAVQSLCPCRAPRGSSGDPRRRGLLPGGARSPGKTDARGGAAGGGVGPRHPADHLAGHSARGRGRPVRRRRLEEAGHLHPVRRVPGRGARDAAEEPGRGTPAQAPGGGDQDPLTQEPRPGPLLRRAPRAGDPLLPEPGGRGGAGDRRSHRPGPPDARGGPPGRSARSLRSRAGVLRRPRDQRQRGAGPGRAYPKANRARVGRDRAVQRDHRLGGAGERAGAAAAPGEAGAPEAQLPAGQAGEGNADGAGANGGAVRAVGLRDMTRISSYFAKRIQRLEEAPAGLQGAACAAQSPSLSILVSTSSSCEGSRFSRE